MATTFTLNYSGQEINNRLARVDDCLAKTAENVDYLQNENNFTIGNNQSQFVFDTSLGTTGTILTLSTDYIERNNSGTITHLDWSDIETKSDIAATYLAKSAEGVTYTQNYNGLTIKNNYGSLLLFPASGPSKDSSIFIGETNSSDKVYLLRNGIKYTTSQGANWATVSYSNIATKTELNTKQNTLVSGTNIKTINGTTLLGSGNIQVAADVESIPDSEIEALFNDATNHSGGGSNN